MTQLTKKVCLILFALLAMTLCAFTAFAAEGAVVFVKDGGTGKGTSETDALGDLADAFTALPNGGTIVLCGNYTLAKSSAYDTTVPAFTAPATAGKVTLTTVYGGKTYAAKLICAAGGRYFCSQDTEFDHIAFSSAKTFVIAARFFDLTIGAGCSTTGVEMHVVGGMEHTNATVGVPNEDYSKDAHVTVLSGTIAELTGLGRNVGKSGGKANYTGTAYLTVGGDAVVNRVFGVYRWGTKTATTGNAVITIDGGKVPYYIAGCGSEGLPYNCDVTVKITKNCNVKNLFTSVSPGRTADGAWYGVTGSGLYSTSDNTGKTALILEDPAAVSEDWIKTYVDTDSFTMITGYKEAAATGAVVFLSDKGNNTNDGLTAETAVKTVAQAFKKLGGAGTVVICGNVTVDTDTLPTANGLVTFTSVFDGVDYRDKADAKLMLSKNLYLGGDVKFEHLQIRSASALSIFCQGHNFTAGEDLISVYSSSPIAIWGGTYCGKSGVSALSARYYDYTIQIDSGTWYYVRGGSLRDGEGQPVGTIGNVTIIINGGTISSTTTDPSKNGIVAVSGFDALDGYAEIIINGGTINCSVMGVGRPGYNATTSNNAYQHGDVRITVNGGKFHSSSKIGALHDTKTSELVGDFYLTVNGGTFPSSFGGLVGSSVLGNTVLSVADGIKVKTTGFDKVIFVSDAGNDANDGLSAASAKKTLAEAAKALDANGGVLVICGNVSVSEETLRAYSKNLRITSLQNGVDYAAKGAKLTVNGTLTLGGATILEHLTLAGNGRISANGYDLTVRETVNGGNLTLDGGKGSATHGVTVNGGSFAAVLGGSVTASEASTYVILNAGTVGKVCGTSGSTVGGTTVSIRGGKVTAGVYAAEKDAAGSCGIELAGGSVAGKIAPSETGKIYGTYAYHNFGATVTATATPAAAKAENVVFVKDGGTGDGSTPAKATSDITAASEKLSNGGTIVICGELSLEIGKSLKTASGKYILTSVYDGIDYRTTAGAQIELRKYLTVLSATEIRDLTIVAAANNTYISAEGADLVIGDGVVCELFDHNRTEDYPALVAGSVAYSTTLKKNTHLTVKSGTWGAVSGGMYSTSSGAALNRKIEGNITLDIYGGRFTDDFFVAGMNFLVGNATLNAYGGEFACSVFGATGSKITVNGDITINACGASFCGDIRAGQNDSPTLNGDYTLNIYGGDLTRVSTVTGATLLSGKGTSALNTAKDIDLSAPLSGNIAFQNPIAGYADPSIVYADGWYYYTYAATYGGSDSIFMAKAANLCDIGKVEPQLIWSRSLTGEAKEMTALWAPQLYYLPDENGTSRWYIYGAVQTEKYTNADANRRLPYVWIGQTDDPMGPYTFYGCLDNIDTEVYNYLSQRYIIHNGKLYMFCSGFWRQSDISPTHIQRLRICEMESPTKMKSAEILLSSPKYAYEANIMEGPYPFYAPDGTLYLIFAGGHTRTDEYCTGIMRFNGSATDDLLDVSLWEKFPEPLQFVNYENGVYSPGAMVVTTSPDGSTYYGVYHAKEYHLSAYTMRRMYMQVMTFDESGFPQMDDAQPTSTIFTIAMNSMPIADRVSGFNAKGQLANGTQSAFTASRTYTDNFTDIPASAWFYEYVKTAYSYALTNGTSGTKYSPESKFAVSHALTAAANIHAAYYKKEIRKPVSGEIWYAPYVEYCVQNGIIANDQFDNYERGITRGEMAIVFANILPEDEYALKRGGSNPDVSADMPCAAAVEKLYRAGIIGGDAGSGNYRPDDEILRAEACVIFTRIAEKSYRAD